MPSDIGVVRWWWWSSFTSRLESLTSLSRLCPVLLLRKSSTLCCVLFEVIRTCSFDLRFLSSRMLSPMLQAKSVSAKHNSRKRYVVFYHISTWVVAWKVESSLHVPIWNEITGNNKHNNPLCCCIIMPFVSWICLQSGVDLLDTGDTLYRTVPTTM